MKKKFLLSVLLSFVFYLLSSQIPQGFNYQAIVRNTAGEVLKDKPLKVTVAIKTALTGGIVLWEEYHNVTSNQFGLVSFAVGSGTYVSGVASFDLIDWKAQPLYLKTTVEYPVGTVTEMGTAPILSVPYSLVAKDVEGPIERLGIRGSESSVDSALFEVRNKIGQTVFAVYPEGVRVYVADGAKGKKGGFAVGSFGEGKAESQKYLVVSKDSIRMYLDSNPLTKAKKGGFAVGGYDMSKGLVQNYLDVSEDSVRIYIDNNPLTKGKKGGFAVGSYDMSKNGIQNFFNVAIDTTGIIKPSQNRILWYPQKNAFMTGKVLIENKDSVGVNSFASGFESKAKGKYSQAMGYKAIARGDYSTAIGKNAVANKINSFAFGESARAVNEESYAFGRGAIASGYRSFALGSAGVDNSGYATDVATASGNYSFAIGQGSKSIGKGSFSIGIADSAIGDFSTAIGYYTNAVGEFSTAMGLHTYATGTEAISIGRSCIASGTSSLAMGIWSSASGSYSIAMGYNAYAKAYGSIAMGYHSSATRDFALATGFGTKANGGSSTAMGWNTNAKSYASVAIGSYNDTTCTSSFSWVPSDPLFVAGNGNGGDASNALTLYKNGNMTIAGILAQNSDFRLKENIVSISNGTVLIEKINPVYFYFKDKNTHPEGRQIGVIAQEVQEVLPELVQKDGRGFLSIDYSKISVILLQAFKEQQQQIGSYKSENDNLKSQLQTLQEKVDRIELLLAKGVMK
ncbi:MAG: tail fiber domain-containing protein [Bacteroidales bacterium]|jgi:hypothetical protein|nr:tail fiber domain-containing protein [Bacteroidales bacterium]